MAGRKPKPTAAYFTGDKSADDVCDNSRQM